MGNGIDNNLSLFYFELCEGIDGSPVLVKKQFTRGEYMLVNALLSNNEKEDKQNGRIS